MGGRIDIEDTARAISTPESAPAVLDLDAGTWIRHRPTASVWCAVASVSDHKAVTECAGSLLISDADEFAVAASPLPGERCGACVRVVDARAIVAGLEELATNAELRPAARPFEMADYSDVEVGGLE